MIIENVCIISVLHSDVPVVEGENNPRLDSILGDLTSTHIKLTNQVDSSDLYQGFVANLLSKRKSGKIITDKIQYSVRDRLSFTRPKKLVAEASKKVDSSLTLGRSHSKFEF